MGQIILIVQYSILALLLVNELRTFSFRNGSFKDPIRVKRNYFYLLASVLTMVLISSSVPYLRAVIKPWFAIEQLWIQLFICFFVAEFFNYVLHYVKHKNKFLWKFHFQHHIETEYNIWITAHTHGLEVFISGLLIGAFMVKLGIGDTAVKIYLAFYSVVNTLQHSQFNYNFGPLNYLIVTPSFHRHHHLKNSDCNYGSTLTIFDYIFQTAIGGKASRNSSDYGIRDSDKPFNFVQEFFFFINPSIGKKRTIRQ